MEGGDGGEGEGGRSDVGKVVMVGAREDGEDITLHQVLHPH